MADDLDEVLGASAGVSLSVEFCVSVEFSDLLEEGGFEDFAQRAHDTIERKLAPVRRVFETKRPEPEAKPAS